MKSVIYRTEKFYFHFVIKFPIDEERYFFSAVPLRQTPIIESEKMFLKPPFHDGRIGVKNGISI